MTKEQRKRFFDFDPKVNSGHLLTILVLIVAAFSWSKSVEMEINKKAHESEIRDLKIEARVSQTVLLLGNLTDRVEDIEQEED